MKCYKNSEPKITRELSLSSLNKSFNSLICVDNFNLGNLRICHIMDANTRYSIGAVVPYTSMESVIEVLDTHWISQFWTPTAIQLDKAFGNDIFCQ